MVDDAAETGSSEAIRNVKAELDERRIARAVAIGLPLVTVTFAAAVGVMIGAPMAILVLASGMLLGVIALFWASLRVLSGDAALSPELEALDATAHAVDALASRKRMLIRALKDLDNERALGKLEEDDYEQLSTTYRAELKELLRRIDATLEPHRPKAEDAARQYLVKAGLMDAGYRGVPPPVASAPAVDDDDDDDDDEEEDDDDDESEAKPAVAKAGAAKAKTAVVKTKTAPATKAAPAAVKAEAKASAGPERVACSSCETSNEIDASFCKKCGASLAKDAAAANAMAKESADEA
jgi:hypothetical protein